MMFAFPCVSKENLRNFMIEDTRVTSFNIHLIFENEFLIKT